MFVLYQQDLMGLDAERALARAEEGGQEHDPYTRRLVLGVNDHREELDRRLESHLRDWSMSRLALVERNIMRLAAFELIYVADVPDAVAIDEAVELAKRFASDEGAGLVHGVLGALQPDLGAA